MSDLAGWIKRAIVDVPDYPKPGILFKDLTPVYQDPALLSALTEAAAAQAKAWRAEAVAGIESRGFVLGAALAEQAGLPLVLLRKQGKLPRDRIAESYALEYGEAVLEVHCDAVGAGRRVMIVDDLLATGGTAAAAARLVGRLGARVAGYFFIVELTFLKGRGALGEPPVAALATY